MSNPYTAPTLSDYNSNPPADDGSAVAANVVKWANHIDKIGDPLKTYAQAISAAASAAHGLAFGQTIVTKSADYTVAAADRGKVIEVDTDAVTITLLAAASAGVGFPIMIVNTMGLGGSTGLVTVDGNSSETINGETSIVLYPGKAMLITSDGSQWVGSLSATPYEMVSVCQGVIGWGSDTTLDDIFPVVPVEANKTYAVDVDMFYTQDGGDIKLQFVTSETATDFKWWYRAQDESATEAADVATASTPPQIAITTMTDAEEVFFRARALITTHASNPGTLSFQGAQNTSDPDITNPRLGSKMIVRRQ